MLCVNRLISALPCIICSQSHQDKAVVSQFAFWVYAALKRRGQRRVLALLHCAAVVKIARVVLPEGRTAGQDCLLCGEGL